LGTLLKGTNQKVLIMPSTRRHWKILTCMRKRNRKMRRRNIGPQKSARST
jgi:hypothetical protein